MNARTSWTGLPLLRQEIDRLFTRFDDDDLGPTGTRMWTPSMDVCESNGNVVITVECPGMDAKDIHVSLTNDLLTIEGEKKTETETREKKGRTYRRERTFGSFSRDIRLPMPVDGSKIKAHLVNGVLTLTVPKSSQARPSEIPIQVH